ncbi:DUF3810 domain-containing protein [soil metagenome]
MTDKFSKGKLKVRLAAIAALAAIIFMLMLLAGRPWFVERYYTEGFYIAVCRFLHPLLNIFPFSVGDLLYIAAIAWLFYAAYTLIRLAFKKDFKQAGIFLLRLIISIQCAVLVFYLFWGMNYFRPSAAERLNLRDSNYTTADMVAVTGLLIDSANATRARLTAADLRQSNSTIYQTAVQAVSKLSADSVNFRTYNPGVKPSLLTPLLNYMSTSGYYNPFTGEAQINYEMPVFARPVVACHEMSHQMGYGAEDEANFGGFIAGIGSRDRLLRYSAYHLAVEEFMHAVRRRDTIAHKELKLRISKAVYNDFKVERDYWLSYENKLGVLSSVFYDNFLKANNQPLGMRTYNRMVLLVMAKFKRPWSIVHSP